MDSYGLSYGIVWSEDVFKKFAATYHVLLQATTLFFLLVILIQEGKPEIIDLAKFQIWKVSFRSMMGLFAAMNASTYLTFRNLYAYYEATGSGPSFYTPSSRFRIFEEMAIFFGILTLVCFLMNLFGLWGIICLPVTPPIVFFGLEFAKLPGVWFKSVEASQSYMHGDGYCLLTILEFGGVWVGRSNDVRFLVLVMMITISWLQIECINVFLLDS